MYHPTLSVADEVRKAAELGYEFLELSPGGGDFFSWHRLPTAGQDEVKAVKDSWGRPVSRCRR